MTNHRADTAVSRRAAIAGPVTNNATDPSPHPSFPVCSSTVSASGQVRLTCHLSF